MKSKSPGISRRCCLPWQALLAIALAALAPAATRPPNVLVILADDQGWGDLSLHGNRDLSTPHIDSLARDGAAFRSFYVCAVCAPTRAEFLTGRYHARSGVRGVSQGSERMDPAEVTIADDFRQAGYATGCFGKWHNGIQYPYHPRARGFDTFFGFCSGHWGDYFDPELEHDGQYIQSKGYITDILTEAAIRFIEQHRDRPFFCYLPLCTPHSPMQVPDADWERHRTQVLQMPHPNADDHARAALAMVGNIDANVGRILSKLDELQLATGTIVIYFSDNGPNGLRWNGGLRGIKGSLDEGGLRSALHVRWPARIKAGTTVPNVAAAIDLLPTLTGLAGVPHRGKRPLDGVNLAELLTDPRQPAPDALASRVVFCSQQGKVSARSSRHRLDPQGRLYDIIEDPGQQHDVSASEAATHRALQGQVNAWRREVGLDVPEPEAPFMVGHPDWPFTELPASDATLSGKLKRSSRYPNCSYILNWKQANDAVRWPVRVLAAGRYEAIIHYSCPEADVGSTIELRLGDAFVQARLNTPHDPPPEGGKPGEASRVERGESLVKNFKPWTLGTIELPAGDSTLILHATGIPGGQAMEFRRLILRRIAPASR